LHSSNILRKLKSRVGWVGCVVRKAEFMTVSRRKKYFKEGDHQEDVDVDMKIVIKRISEK
jgi:hypothetical protein